MIMEESGGKTMEEEKGDSRTFKDLGDGD